MPKKGAIAQDHCTIQATVPNSLDIEFRKRMAALGIKKVSPAMIQAMSMWVASGSQISTGTASTKPDPSDKSVVVLKGQVPYTVSQFRDKLAGLPREFEKIVGEIQHGVPRSTTVPTSEELEPGVATAVKESLTGKKISERGREGASGVDPKRRKSGIGSVARMGGQRKPHRQTG